MQRLYTVHDLLLMSDQRHAEFNDVFEHQLSSVVDRQDAGTGELFRVAIHLDAGQPLGSRLRRHRRRIVDVVTGQQQLRALRPVDSTMLISHGGRHQSSVVFSKQKFNICAFVCKLAVGMKS